jgi:hypothetical protein
VQEQYEKNRLATAREQRRRWRGHVVDNAKTIDRTYGRENFAVVRYGGAEARPTAAHHVIHLTTTIVTLCASHLQ